MSVNDFFKILFLVCVIVVAVKVIMIQMVKELLWLLRLEKNGISTNGIIVGINEKNDLDQYKQYAKIIQFTTELKKEIVFESHEFFYKPPVIGQAVKVMYDRNNPNNAVESFLKTVAFKIFLLLVVCTILIFITIVVVGNVSK